MSTTFLANSLSARLDRCANCGQVKPITGKDRCQSCYRYLQRRGYDRTNGPAYSRLKCDCGRPARHKVPIRVGVGGCRAMSLNLCDDCLKLEQANK